MTTKKVTTNHPKTKLKPEHLMKMYQVTRAEAEVQLAILDLWYKHYTDDTLTTADRIRMSEEFTATYLDSTKIKIDKPFIRHPMTYRKQFQRNSTIAEVLADFILRIDQVAERDEEYPIHSAEKVFVDGQKAQQREVSLYTQAERDRDEALSPNSVTPPYSLDEAVVVAEMSQVGQHSEDYEAPDIAKFRETLRKVKANPKRWAQYFSLKGYDYNVALQKIKRLDIGRVRECNECGEPFYAHDLRRNICDLQYGIVKRGGEFVRSELSHCEVGNAKKRSEKQRETA